MNYYQILGLVKEATYDEIKERYKQLVLKYPNDEKIHEAYRILSDPYKRGRYDASLEKKFKLPALLGFDLIEPFIKWSPKMTTYNYSSSTIGKLNEKNELEVEEKVYEVKDGKSSGYHKKYTLDRAGKKHRYSRRHADCGN